MQPLEDALDPEADRTAFSGVVRVDRSGTIELAKAYGLADRRHGIPNTIDTQFGIASGTKGLTALAVVSLIEGGTLELTTTARSVLGEDLPLIHESNNSCRTDRASGTSTRRGEQVTDYVLPVPSRAHDDGGTSRCSTVTPPRSRQTTVCAYNNGGCRARVDLAERTTMCRSRLARRVAGRRG
jgi:hypothetical protein